MWCIAVLRIYHTRNPDTYGSGFMNLEEEEEEEDFA